MERFPAALNGRVVFGAACWVLTAVFFAGQGVAQAASTAPYGLTRDYISDLGVTTCGTLSSGAYQAAVCSPLHAVMNATFVATGVLLALGAIATRAAWPRRRLVTWGLGLLVVAGAGKVLVGLAPANVNIGLHAIGALLGIPGADVGVLLLGLAIWRARPWIAIAGALVGMVGVSAFVLLAISPQSGLGAGTVERLADWPAYVWLIGVGGALLASWTTALVRTPRAGPPGSGC